MTKGIKTGSFMHAQFFMSYTFGRPLEYDPNDAPELEKAAQSAEGLPKELLVGLLKGLINAGKINLV